MKGVTFEKDASGKNRFVRFDLEQYGEQLRPLLQELGIEQKPEGWEDGLTSEEFLTAAKKILRKKFALHHLQQKQANHLVYFL